MLLILLIVLLNYFLSFADLDGNQPVVFYYVDPGYALERHAGKAKFKNKFYYQYEREESWTHPGVRDFGRVNGILLFKAFKNFLAMLFHCAMSFMQTNQAQLKIAPTIPFTVSFCILFHLFCFIYFVFLYLLGIIE